MLRMAAAAAFVVITNLNFFVSLSASSAASNSSRQSSKKKKLLYYIKGYSLRLYILIHQTECVSSSMQKKNFKKNAILLI